MDKQLIEQYGQEILSYRIRTARQKKRAVYEYFDKHLLALNREERALMILQQNLGWEPLVPPVQKGWIRSFVLRDDVARGRRAEFFTNILRKINTYEYSYRKDFKVKKRKMGRKIYVVKPQELLKPDPQHFEKLNFSGDEKRFFYIQEYHNATRNLQYRYVFSDPWMFVLKVRPNIIDRVRIKDAVLEQRLDEIDHYFKRNDYTVKLLKLLHGDKRWGHTFQGEEYRNPNPIKNKTLTQILDEAKEEIL